MEGKGITRRSALKLMGGSALAAIIATSGASLLTSCGSSKKRVVLYFTGTGNCLYVARQLAGDDGEYSMSRFARMYGFTYEGMATSTSEAKTLKNKLK